MIGWAVLALATSLGVGASFWVFCESKQRS